jgi:hypothetical protein
MVSVPRMAHWGCVRLKHHYDELKVLWSSRDADPQEDKRNNKILSHGQCHTVLQLLTLLEF